jgi:ketosteroid isomerase-like protein
MSAATDGKALLKSDREQILRWLETFAAAVCATDFSAGRSLCEGEIFSFGTVAALAWGLDELESSQWRKVWGVTTGFAFDIALMHCGGGGDNFWVAVPWSSSGQVESQKKFERRGRATIVLRKAGDRLLAVHTHFSLAPANGDVSIGRESQISEGSPS